MSNLTPDEKAALMGLMTRLLEDDTSEALAEAIETEAAASVERAETYAEHEAAELEAQRAHELAVIDAQADATVRVIEAETAGAAAVASIDAAATVQAADALSVTIDTPALELPDVPAETDTTLDAAADLLGELTAETPDPLESVPVLELPDVPAMLEDVAPKASHWWTRERGRRR